MTDNLRHLEELVDDEVSLVLQHSDLSRLKAREAIITGANPLPHFNLARERAISSLDLPIDRIEAALLFARLAWAEHQWRRQTRGCAGDLLISDLDRLEGYLEERPDEHRVRAWRGRLALLASRCDALPESRRGSLAVEARRELDRALAGNPLLKARFSEALDQAQALGTSGRWGHRSRPCRPV